MDNAKTIWDYFKEKGLNEYGIAGLMGNLKAESNLNPKNLQQTYEKSLKMTDDSYTKSVDDGTYINFINDKAGYGLAQWTWWSRKENLLKFANKEYALSIGLRSMSPEIIITDELCTIFDWKFAKKASNSGIKIIASMHADKIEDSSRL